MAFEDLGDRYNSGFGREIDDNINRNQGGDGGRRRPPQTPPPLDEPPVVVQKPFSRLAQKISDGNPQTTDYSVSMEYQNFYGGGTTLTGPLATGNFSGLNTYNQDVVKVRKVDLNELGTAGQLGSGDYVLESLYLNTHKNNPNRQPINTGRLDENGNPILIPTIRAGMGNLDGLDIKGYSTDEISYRGSNRGNEPYQISEIGSEYKDPIPNSTERMLQFYNTPAGKALIARENITDYLSKNPPKIDLKKAKKLTIGRAVRGGVNFLGGSTEGFIEGVIKKSFVPGHNALLTNLLINRATLDFKDRRLFEIGGQSINLNQALGAIGTNVGDLLGEFGKRYDIDYSARTRTGAPFGELGDKPYNLSYLQRIKKVNEGESGTVSNYLKKQQNKLHKFGVERAKNIEDAKVTKITPFMDLTGEGNHSDGYSVNAEKHVRAHGYDDKISNSGVEILGSTLDDFSTQEEIDKIKNPLEDELNEIMDGDFYVRFKDLRDNRFIYFRGYINGITENLSPSWTSTNYIGRSEPVYSYERAERDISFNLAVYPQNNGEEQFMYEKMNRLTSMVYPEYQGKYLGTDDQGTDVFGNEQIRMKPPFTEMFMAHIGSKAKGQFGYIKSLSYTVNESGDWNALELLPRVFNIAISYQIVSKRPPSIKTQFYRPSLASSNDGRN